MKDTTKKATKKEIRRQAAAVAEFIKTAPAIIRDGLESFLVTADNAFQVTTVRNAKDGTEIDRKGLAEFLQLAQERELGHHSGGFYTGNLEAAGQPDASGTTPRLMRYTPEIEARRADYLALAECFATMIELETRRAAGVLDIAAPGVMSDEPNSSILIGGLRDHVSALFENIHAGMIYEADFLHIIYPELRLYYDHKCLEHRMGAFSYLRAGETLQHRHTPEGAHVKIKSDIYSPLGIKNGDRVYYCMECKPQEGEIAFAISADNAKQYIGRVKTADEGIELLVADHGDEGRDVFDLAQLSAKIIGKVYEAKGAEGGTACLL